MSAPIAVGAFVRSFDFEGRDTEGERASYIEGEVLEITDPAKHPHFQDVARYRIAVTLRKGGGNWLDVSEACEVYPPVNGLKISCFSSLSSGVELLNSGAA